MDIRNFFGGGKKKPKSDAAAAAPRSSTAKKSNGKSTTATTTKKEEPAASNRSRNGDKKASTTTSPSSTRKKEASKKTVAKQQRQIGSDDDTEMEDNAPAKKESSPRSSPRKRKDPPTKKANDGHYDDFEEIVAKKPAISSSGGGNRGLFARKSEGKKVAKRKIVIDSDSDDEVEVVVGKKSNDGKSEDDDDGDEDFKGAGDNSSDDSDEEVKEKPKGKKRAASPPKKKPPTPTKKAAPPPHAKKLMPKAPEKETPPKYHPPSSKLTAKIPYLKNDTTILIQTELPKLPKTDKSLSDTFSIDNMTPMCLEGITFVFSGILTTNDAKTRETNSSIALNSPSKGEYYQNRNAYTTSTISGVGCDEELARDLASDLVLSLGGKVTSAVSGKTDYLVVGSILEDGREVEEGSKYRKALEIWEVWKEKNRVAYKKAHTDGGGDDDGESEEESGGRAKKRKVVKKKPQAKSADPNSLVEIIRGVQEFYGLITFLSDWKKGTLPEEEQRRLERQMSGVKEEANPAAAALVATLSLPAASANPTPRSAASAVVNPYATTAVANPYNNGKKSPANPHAAKLSSSVPSSAHPAQKFGAASTTTHHQDHSGKVHINALWADKYAPINTQEILGNGGNVSELTNWLKNWEHQFNNPKRKVKSVSGPNGPWKAALLSGPPGIGKTTTATLVARESGRDLLELNASDARSKKSLSQALGDVTGSQVLNFRTGDGKVKHVAQKRCIIMDEVDGMGAGDRSGMSELIQMIKNSKVPIICICNDRSSQKMKSLVQYCMDLRFQRPNKKTIGRRAVEIGRVEGMEVEENAAEAMSESCGNDIRQVLNCMQMWSCKKNEAGQSSSVTYKDLKDRQSDINKDEVLRVSMFDATKLIVEGPRDTGSDAKKNNDSFFKRTDAFFVDYMLMGLNIHQNYLKVCVGQYNNAKTRGDDDLELAALDAVHDATLAMSDFGIVEENLRGGDQNWALLPLCSVLAAKVGLLDKIVTTLSCCLRSKLASHFISLFPSIHPNTRLDFTPVDPLEDSCLGILSLLDGLERTQLATKKFGCWESFATT